MSNRSFLPRGGRPHVGEQVEQLAAEGRRSSLGETRAGVTECRPEALGAEGLQQVIERENFERAERVFVVRGDEHDGGHLGGFQRAQQLEPVELGHLHIEEEQIG